MTVDLGLVRRVEALAFRAFPPTHSHQYAGWTIRITEAAPNRRVNSATTPLEIGEIDPGLDYVERYYRQRARTPIVRVVSTAPHAIDDVLAGRGYVAEAVTLVMTAAVARRPGPQEIAESPSAAWVTAKARLSGMSEAEIDAWRSRLATVPGRVGYSAEQINGDIVAIAMGVVDDGWVGLFDVNTLPSLRRSGYGAHVTSEILAWASAWGATRSYLQVMDDNEAAKGLYRSLGFVEAYRYWYRREPSAPTGRRTTS